MTGVARVVAVAADAQHRFSKRQRTAISLIAGLGVQDDAHAGVTVQHRSRLAIDPAQPNLRQVHLLHAELLDELAANGFAIAPADLGENVITRGIDLLSLPRGTILRLGDHAAVEVTGLRNPCAQIERFRAGLLGRVASRLANGAIERRAGVMSVVLEGGAVRAGDAIDILHPSAPHRSLEPV